MNVLATVATQSQQAPRPDIEVAKVFVKAVLPSFDYIISQVQKNGSWVGMPREITELAAKLNISNWTEVFLDEKRYISMQYRLFALLPGEALRELFSDGVTPLSTGAGLDFDALPESGGDERARALMEAINSVPSEQQSGLLNHFFKHLTTFAKELDNELDNLPPSQHEVGLELLGEIAPEKQQVVLRAIRIFCIACVTMLLNYLSLATHGQKLTVLVQRAINGDDEAFWMAVQVDKTLLTHLPQFRDRYWRAVVEGDANFLEYLSYRLRNPTIRGRRNHYHTLWLVFVILDDLNVLDKGLTNEAILDIYKAIPEDHVCKPIDDVEYVRKQRAAYMRLKRQTK